MSTILIVDDDPTARETLEAMLEGQGDQLELAVNGFEALEIAGRIHPDLILLDVMMPAMDGFEVCRRLRSTPQLAEVPIVILTALDDHASLMTGIEAGADDYLTKPINRQELVARVRTITRLNRYRTLMEQRENLREMAGRVIIAQEEERKRISRELHDDLGQALTTHMLDLRNLQEDVSDSDKELCDRLQLLRDHTDDIFSTIYRLAQDLRPPALDTLGLKLAIQTYCTEYTRHSNLPVDIEIDQTLPEFSDVYNITLYRALQEALNNILKHAQANQVWVELCVEDNMIALTVQDNGKGFIYNGPQSNGIGLIGLDERLTLAGGNLKVTSTPKRGTILSAQLPLSEAYAAQDSA
jgi:signal transduction histidine kinase